MLKRAEILGHAHSLIKYSCHYYDLLRLKIINITIGSIMGWVLFRLLCDLGWNHILYPFNSNFSSLQVIMRMMVMMTSMSHISISTSLSSKNLFSVPPQSHNCLFTASSFSLLSSESH